MGFAALYIFRMILNLVDVYAFFDASTTKAYTCTEKHSSCELLRRIPSLCLAPSIEVAFAVHCMHTRITAMWNAAKSFMFCHLRNLGSSCRQLGKNSRFCLFKLMRHGLAMLGMAGQRKVLQLRFHEHEWARQNLSGPMHRGGLAWTAVLLMNFRSSGTKDRNGIK